MNFLGLHLLRRISLPRLFKGWHKGWHLGTGNLGSKARPLREPLVLWVVGTIFAILYSIAVHHVLLKGNPRIGGIVLSATDTNYVVSVLSQFFATLVARTLEAALDSLRWALAARNRGLSFGNFVQLSGATDLFIVTIVMAWSKFRSCSGIIRLLIPVGSLFFGSILKFKADFQSYFIPMSDRTPLFAGLMPINTQVLDIVPVGYLCLYFSGWVPSLLGTPKYAVDMSGDTVGCNLDQNCTSFFLPGGLEIARKVQPVLNATILEGGVFNDAEVIRINDAPGMLLRFERLNKFPFDHDKDCLYYGDVINDTIQICIADRNQSIAVSLAACPSILQEKNLCDAHPSWKLDFNYTVLLTVSRRKATTTYSRRDLKILRVLFSPEETASESIPLSRSQYQPIWDRMLRFSADESRLTTNETEIDRSQIRSLAYSLAWLIRLYADVFPDDPFTPLTHLQNFLAIPVQFSTVCSQYANYTVHRLGLGADLGGVFAMDEQMLTTAEGGHEADRLVSQPWTVWAFIAGSTAAMLGTAALLGYMMLWVEKPLPKGTGIPEVDILALTQGGVATHPTSLAITRDAGQMIRELKPEIAGSVRKTATTLCKTRLSLVSSSNGSDSQSVLTELSLQKS